MMGSMRYVDAETTKPVSVIGLGTWQFGSKEWGYGPEYATREAAAIVRRAIELGVTLFDTAELYARGGSERILGRAIRAAGTDPESLVIASKIWPVMPLAPVVEQRAVASARRLGVRALDLYQVHMPNPVIRDSTIMRGMQSLQQVGVVRDVGVSNYSAKRWEAADVALSHAWANAREESLIDVDGNLTPVVVSNQVQYSLAYRGAEADVIPYAAARGRCVIGFSPLAMGMLSGRFGLDNRPRSGVRAVHPVFLESSLQAAQPLLTILREVADAHGATSSQIALAWCIRHPHVAVIPGASSVAQVESNVAAAEISLRDDEVAALDAASEDYRMPSIPATVVEHAQTRTRVRGSR